MKGAKPVPLERSPLRQGTTPLKRSRIKHKPVDEDARLARRLARGEVSVRSGGRCEAKTPDCTGGGRDAHEVITRSMGGSITDTTNILWVCRACHDWIHNKHPGLARERGLLASRHKGYE